MTASAVAPPPAGVSRRAMLAGGALATAAFLAHGLRPRRMDGGRDALDLDALLPARIGAWRAQDDAGIVLPMPDDAPYDRLTTRSYESPGLPAVMLLAAWGDGYDGARFSHRPENCYAAAGFAVGPSTAMRLPVGDIAIPMRSLTARLRGRDEQIGYWVRIGDELPTTAIAQRLAVLRQNLRGVAPDGLLMRFSTIGAGPALASAAIASLARALLLEGTPALREMLVGPALASRIGRAAGR